jgi:hypothetical protein
MDENNEKKTGLNLQMSEKLAKGVHAQDVLISVTATDVCLTFYVRDPSGQQGFVTSRVFLPLNTAMQLSELIRKLLGPAYQQYLDAMKNMPPASGGTGE